MISDPSMTATPSPKSMADPPEPQQPITKKEIFGWCMYDVADSAFTTVIVTALYALYFGTVVVGDVGRADYLWGWGASISEAIVAVLAPILGAIADFSGSRKKFLGVCALTIIFFTAALWFVGPGMVTLGLGLYIIANVGFAGGGLICVLLTVPLANYIKPNPTDFELSRARLIPVVVAIYYAVAVIPTFLFLRDRSVPRQLPPGEKYLTVGFRQLKRTLSHIRQYQDLFRLLLAFLVYNDGVVTVIYFAARYAKETVGFSPKEIVYLLIINNVVAAAGAFSFGFLADRIGQKRTIYLTLIIWIAAVTVAYFSYSKNMFYVASVLVGIGIGSCQSVTRSLLALFTPKENAAEFFGFLGIAGKALAFLGPIIFGTISRTTGSQRPAILSIGAFFVAGMILLSLVNEQRGKEAARIPVEAHG